MKNCSLTGCNIKIMKKVNGKSRYYLNSIEHVIFKMINGFLSYLVGNTRLAWIIFHIFGRILPIPQVTVRGVPVKVIIPLNEVGVYNTVKTWEAREPEVLDWIDNFEPGCIFFDIGASFGTETLYAALKRGGPAKIVAFDLTLSSSFNLALNINLNSISNVDQYYLALSEGLKLTSFSEPIQYYFVKSRPKYNMITYKTVSISLDQFVGMTGIIPDYIKIDVDGAEVDLVLGMSETVKNERLKSVVVEVTDQSEAVITDILDKAGFKVVYERVLEEEEHRIFKNIIFSRRRTVDPVESPSTPGE
jgi:FkbM family methyltransferase